MSVPSIRKLHLRTIIDHGSSFGGPQVAQRTARAIADAVIATMLDPRRAQGAAHHLSALRDREQAKRRHALRKEPR